MIIIQSKHAMLTEIYYQLCQVHNSYTGAEKLW